MNAFESLLKIAKDTSSFSDKRFFFSIHDRPFLDKKVHDKLDKNLLVWVDCLELKVR